MKYALVTGASSGIGWHISKELAQRGYYIVAVSNQPEQLEALKKELEHTYLISVVLLNMDLARASAAKEVFDYCDTNQLEVEVLVNNAGMLVLGEAVRIDYQKAADIIQL
ncbi:MAG: SDR family NAD(P)-dependent oxidoreductase, partial [Cyclobacteriaceae bacterium]|nr:SDR family NAD(P)-dependent oxidoreductase [Cyclobacteriaceae bacterium]